jgi:putative peptide zinc metalloprotease protein
MIKSSKTQVTSSDIETLPLRARRDLKIQQSEFRGEQWHVVKDPIALQYFQLRPDELRTLELLNGTRSFEQILTQLRGEFPALLISSTGVQTLLLDLRRKGLIVSIRSGRGQSILSETARQKSRKLLSVLFNPFFIKLPGYDPQPILGRIYPLFRWMFWLPVVFLSLAFICASWIQVAVRFETIQNQIPALAELVSWPNVLLLWLTLGATKIVHEIAHGLTCHHFGGECHEIGVCLMVFSPSLYCDVSDSWMLPKKKQRILVAAAGIYIEVLMSALSLLAWSMTQPGLLNALLMNIFLVTSAATVIYNANPLLRYDGYYMLADWLEIPNLRSKADREVQRFLMWSLAGVSAPDVGGLTTGRRTFFLSYAVASFINRWLMLLVFAAAMFHVLRPFGLSFVALLCLSLSLLFGLHRFTKRVRESLSFSGHNPMKPARIVVTLLAMVGLGLTIFLVPIPVNGYAPVVIEPDGLRNVYSQMDGFVSDILAQPGDDVVTGQVLLVLRNDDLQKELATIQSTLRKRQIDCILARALKDSSRLELAEAAVKTAEEELELLRQKQSRLTVVASCDGRLLDTPEVSESELNEALPVLNKKNQGAWINTGTPVCSIAPDNGSWRATLFVDHSGHQKIQAGDTVTVRLSDRPGMSLPGQVLNVAPREENVVPAALSTKFGGPMVSVTDPSTGHERLSGTLYRASIRIDSHSTELLAGMKGTGRFEISRPSAFGWVSDYVRRTLDVPY